MFIAIIPAYNEEKNIGSVIRNLLNLVDRVVVVDDGSLDQTAAAARAAGATVLGHKLNRGQGAAIETGHEYARIVGADFVIHFDGDGQFCVDDVGPALAALRESGADMLFGSRFLGNKSRLPFFKKHILLPLARSFQNFFVGVKLTDAHNGFRILTARALAKIRLVQDRMAHATEIVEAVKAHRLKYIEFPVRVVYRKYGQGFREGMSILKDLLLGKFIRK